MAKNLLIIDNENLDETIEELHKQARKKSIALNCYPLYIGLPDGNDVVDDNGKIDLKLVKKKFEENYGETRFHMVASDFALNDEIVDGIDIIKQFNNISNTLKAKKILYSSELEEIVQGYLNDHKKSKKNFDEAWDKFKTLIKIDIVDFAKREEVESKIISYIEKVVDDNNDFIIDNLLANGDLEFNGSMDIYRGYSLKEIADKIKDNDEQANAFKIKLIELAIAELIELKDV
jgi:hypothetical protein